MPTLDELLTQRIPPHDLQAERALLGACLLDGVEALSRVAERLSADDFYADHHKRLWRCYRDLVADEMAIDQITVRARLPLDVLDGTLGAVAVWLAELMEEAVTLTELRSYAAIVRGHAVRRRTHTWLLRRRAQCWRAWRRRRSSMRRPRPPRSIA